MAHDRDRDHPTPAVVPPKSPQPGSLQKPDRIRAEHPTSVPREPVDPKMHPRRIRLREARPA
jgi:hypothetical protein